MHCGESELRPGPVGVGAATVVAQVPMAAAQGSSARGLHFRVQAGCAGDGGLMLQLPPCRPCKRVHFCHCLHPVTGVPWRDMSPSIASGRGRTLSAMLPRNSLPQTSRYAGTFNTGNRYEA